MSEVLLAVAFYAFILIGGLSVAYLAARVYLRAAQIQAIWSIRIDALSEHAWGLLRDRVSPQEFQAVVKRLESHNLARATGIRIEAPTVADVLRNLNADI